MKLIRINEAKVQKSIKIIPKKSIHNAVCIIKVKGKILGHINLKITPIYYNNFSKKYSVNSPYYFIFSNETKLDTTIRRDYYGGASENDKVLFQYDTFGASQVDLSVEVGIL